MSLSNMVWWLRSPNIGVTNLSMKWLTISIFRYCSNDNQTQIETKPTYLKTGHKSMKTATLKTFVAEVNEGIGVHVSFARNKNQVKRWQSVQVNCWKKEMYCDRIWTNNHLVHKQILNHSYTNNQSKRLWVVLLL